MEFDGPTHADPTQVHRDATKNRLCEYFGLPLLRINARYLPKKYRDMDLLTWFVDAWFHSKAFYEAQDSGAIPQDEPFDPHFLWKADSAKSFPMWLTRDINTSLRDLHKRRRIRFPGASHVIGKDSSGTFHAIAFIEIDSASGVVRETAMRSQSFPIDPTDILDDIAVYEAYEELVAVLDHGTPPTPLDEIFSMVKTFREHYEVLISGSIGAGPGQ